GVSVIHVYNGADDSRFVLKIFKTPRRVPWDKLEHLQRTYEGSATSLPTDPAQAVVAWPISFIYRLDSAAAEKTRVGFTMVYLDPDEWPSLDTWIEPNLRPKLTDDLDSLSRRLRILINTAAALDHLHARGAAMIDLKPDNMRVNKRTRQIA